MPQQPFAGQNRSGEPIISHDGASIADLQIIETIDVTKADYERLALGSQYPGYVDQQGFTKYEGCTVIDEQVVPESAGQYVHRIWQSLPGSWNQESYIDKDTGGLVTVKTRKNVPANIAESAVISGTGADTILTVTSRKDISTAIADEVVTVYARPEAHDESSALVGYRSLAYSFPGWIQPEQISWTDADHTAVQRYEYNPHHQQALAKIVLARVLTWYELSENPPTAPTIDEVITDSVLLAGSGQFNNVLHDALAVYATNLVVNAYGSGYHDISSIVVHPPTTPSFAEYTGLTRLAGSVNLTYGSNRVTGNGTAFDTSLVVGQQIQFGSVLYQRGATQGIWTIQSFDPGDGDTTMFLTANVGTVGSGATFTGHGTSGNVMTSVTVNTAGANYYPDGAYALTVPSASGPGARDAVAWAVIVGGRVIYAYLSDFGYGYNVGQDYTLTLTIPSGASFVAAYEYDPGAWIGNEKTIDASVVSVAHNKLWKFEKVLLVMR